MDDSLTDHIPSDGLPQSDQAWLMQICVHGRICSRLIYSLFSQAALHAPRCEMVWRITEMHGLLESWRQERRTEEGSLLGHNLLVLLVHGKWVQLARADLGPEEVECFRRSERQCVDAARAILEECSQLDHAGLLTNL